MALLSYVKGLSEATARVFKKHGISTAFKPTNTIGQHLFRLKDKKDPSVCGDAIYEISCKKL